MTYLALWFTPVRAADQHGGQRILLQDARPDAGVEIPVGMTARVGLPQPNAASTTLVVNGKQTEASIEDGTLFVDGIGSGRHVITCGSKSR